MKVNVHRVEYSLVKERYEKGCGLINADESAQGTGERMQECRTFGAAL